MNGWMPMLNLAFNDYNMSGENKLLLTMQTKGTVLLVYKQICKVFKSKNEEKMKCVITNHHIISTVMSPVFKTIFKIP